MKRKLLKRMAEQMKSLSREEYLRLADLMSEPLEPVLKEIDTEES